MAEKKVLIVGLDCASPELVFDRWRGELPNLASLIKKGVYGPLQSCVPPITVPAWSCMMSGKSPGTLGCYGFRNRSSYSYEALSFATSRAIREDRLWDILSRHNKKVILVGVPQTYPASPVSGFMVTGLLTPDTGCPYTYPPELAKEIEASVGEYIIDVDTFRTDDKSGLLSQVYEMTEKRFSLFSYLLDSKPWDFSMIVEMGIDRMQHAFWKYIDPRHPAYEAGSPHENAVLDYYRFVDARIGELLDRLDSDTAVLVVSDHGAQANRGGFCINEWLIQQGYLRLIRRPDGLVPISKAAVDWEHTAAWGEGGYYARLFLNVRGREPQGCVAPDRYEHVRAELAAKLASTVDQDGNSLKTRVFRPEDIYANVNGIPPDLFVYFGDLSWRSIGSVGHSGLYSMANDTGPDDANHAERGICILCRPDAPEAGMPARRNSLSILDIAPTVLDLFGLGIPADMEGTVIDT